MGFFRDLCDGLIGNCRNCMTTPITRKKMYWCGGVSLAVILLIIIICVSVPGGGSGNSTKGSDALRESPLCVGFDPTPAQFHGNTTVEKFNKDLVKYILESPIKVQIFAAGTGCSAQYKDSFSITMDQVDYLSRLIPKLGLRLVSNVAEIHTANSYGTVGGLILVNGGQSLDLRLSTIRTLYRMGVRIISVNSFNCSTPWAKAAYASEVDGNKALSDYGKAMIAEMNRLGILIDIAGADIDTQEAILNESKAPVVAIGVGLKSVKDHPLNMDQNKIVSKFKEKGGLLMVTMDCNLFAPNVTSCGRKEFTNLLKECKTNKINVGLGGAVFPGAILPKDLSYKDTKSYFDWLYGNGYSFQFLRGLAGDNFIQTLKKVQEIAAKNKNTSPREDFFDKSKLNTAGCYTDVSPTVPPTDKPTPTKATDPTTKATDPTTKPTDPTTKPTEPTTTPKKTGS